MSDLDNLKYAMAALTAEDIAAFMMDLNMRLGIGIPSDTEWCALPYPPNASWKAFGVAMSPNDSVNAIALQVEFERRGG